MFCKECGSEVPEGAESCPACGARQDVEKPAGNAASPEGSASQPSSADVMKTASQVARNVADAATHAVGQAADKLNEIAGGTGHVDLRFADFFDRVLKRHNRSEAEGLFACGGPTTTPELSEVSREWPHPWLYSRVFLVLLVSLACFWGISYLVANGSGAHASYYAGFAGFMLMSVLIVNVTVLTFFFETNAPRNLSLAAVLGILFVGGALSQLVTTLAESLFSSAGAFGAILSSVIATLAQAALIYVFMSRLPHRNYVFTGMLVGAAVGAGFAVFDGLGKIVSVSMSCASVGFTPSAMFAGMGAEGLWLAAQALGGHVVTCAVLGGSLALCDKGEGLTTSSLTSQSFLPFLGIVLAVRILWTIDFEGVLMLGTPLFDLLGLKGLLAGAAQGTAGLDSFTIIHALLTVFAWVMVAVMLNRALAQMNELTSEAAAESRAESEKGEQAATIG